MFPKLRSKIATAAAVAAFLLSTAHQLHAQTGERSRWDQVTLGNANVGLDIIGWARTRNIGTERRVDEAAWTQVRLLGATVEMQRIAATAIKNGSSFYGSAGLRRGGLTVRLDSLSASGTLVYSSSGNVFGSNPHGTFFILGIPITVSANIGHTGVMNTSLLNWTGSNASVLSGYMESYAHGWASVVAGIPGLQAGVQGIIQIGRQRFDGVLGAYTNYINTSYLGYSMTAIRLYVQAFLQVGFLTGTLGLVDVTSGARTLMPFIP